MLLFLRQSDSIANAFANEMRRKRLKEITLDRAIHKAMERILTRVTAVSSLLSTTKAVKAYQGDRYSKPYEVFKSTQAMIREFYGAENTHHGSPIE